MLQVAVNIDVKGLKRFSKVVESDIAGRGSGPIRAAMRQWGVIYRSFAQRRFKTFSRGGGNWPPLKRQRKRDIAAAKKKSKPKGASILINTGTLKNALNPTLNVQGGIQKDIAFGIEVGYGGPARHPSGKGVSISDIASFHQEGRGHLPKREIIVRPDAGTVKLMAAKMQQAIVKLGQEEIEK